MGRHSAHLESFEHQKCAPISCHSRERPALTGIVKSRFRPQAVPRADTLGNTVPWRHAATGVKMASQVTNVSNIFKSREPMATNIDQRAVARLPTKAPSRLRFQGILDEAERLILEHGL